ncbi:SpoIID/LytB domain-containing protein [Candidatus Falkowbacteria bacterium]|nr:SpoIID/LytB domain-containing protein [Candidatus Falkowbacteria bacterium]
MSVYPQCISCVSRAEADKWLKECRLYRKSRENGTGLNILGYVLFSFLLVAISASGLRFIETTLATPAESRSLLIGTAMAAEPIDRAELSAQSNTAVYLKPNAADTFTLQFKNIGTSIWNPKNIYLKPLSTALTLRHASWVNDYIVAQLQEKSVLPGETGTLKFGLQAPKNIGHYSGDFSLVNSNVMIDGGEIAIKVTVVENPENYSTVKPETSSGTKPKLNICSLKLNIAAVEDSLDNTTCANQLSLPPDGPNIRVGILNTKQAITIANSQPWEVYDQNNALLATVPADLEMRFFYHETKNQYIFDFINQTIRTNLSFKLKNSQNGIFTITSYKDIPTWNKSINYNQFVGDLEIARYEKSGNLWLIENLALEKYLKGMKETSDEDPLEYQRAMTVAARTYALYHVNKFKTQESFFDVYSDEKDQVYKGHQAELVMPKQAQAVEETRGVIATYADQVIIAYYSARSGGQTIAYKNLPYLQSVQTPYTKALGKWGHAIGIDAIDARKRAEKDGWTYDQIIKYYYTNVALEKIY